MRGRGQKLSAALAPAVLLLGFVTGTLSHASQAPFLLSLGEFLGSVGNLWTHALQLAILPLVTSLLIAGIGGMDPRNGFGRWGWISLSVFLGFLVGGAVLVLAVGQPYLAMAKPAALDLAGLAGIETPQAKALGFGEWLESLLPSNLIQAAADGQMLPVTLCAILFAAAVRALPEEPRNSLLLFFRALRDAVLVYLSWVVLLLPLGAFALAFAFSAKAGFAVAGATLHFLLFTIALLMLGLLLLYPVAWLLGRVGVGRFARAAVPAQAVAVGTRSSLASFPALVESSKALGLPEPAHEVVLPLAVSTFKPNRTISSTAKLLFLGAVCGVVLSPADIATFVVTVIVLSVSSPGIPSVGTRITYGAYVAAGLPGPAVILMDAVDGTVDLFKTAYNVTAMLAVAAVVSRLNSSEASVQPAPEPAAL